MLLFIALAPIFIWSCQLDTGKVPTLYNGKVKDVKLSIITTDSLLATSFRWAAQQAMHYVHDGSDPVGLWYEAALPQREAFCMRDVAHQSTGAHLLGLAAHNKNMLQKFAENISESKDWCSYWEINRYNVPAPVDYRNDKEFWYNLPANYDVVDACYRQYLWTGDPDYIQNQLFTNFYQRSMENYTQRWQLGLDEIMQRNRWINTPVPLDSNDYFHICRGLPSYEEGDPFQLAVGADLLGFQYKARLAWANMLELTNNQEKATLEQQKAIDLKSYFLSNWYNDSTGTSYQAWFRNKGFVARPSQFLLYTGIAHSAEHYEKEVDALVNFGKKNIESQSYMPLILSRYDQNKVAYNHILDLSSPEKKRREYPEVSFAVIESVVVGLAGVDADARTNQIATLNRIPNKEATLAINNIPVFDGTINIFHGSATATKLKNETGKPINWRIQFYGTHDRIRINGKAHKAEHGFTLSGKAISYVRIELKNKEEASASI